MKKDTFTPSKSYKINFVGGFTRDILGDPADEVHICDGLDEVGHKVHRCPRDIWKAYVDGHKPNDDWILPEKADINIIVKWHHFIDGRYIDKLKEVSGAPVFYWQFDWMKWPNPPEWHKLMAMSANLHLTHELGDFDYIRTCDVKPYYISASVANPEYDSIYQPKKHEVIFTGSFVNVGDRVEWIKEINKKHPVKVWSYNWKEWAKEGIESYEPVYGYDFADLITQSKIVLGFNVNDHCYGYWSNRVARVLCTGGVLLHRYTPGMELFLKDGAEYFSSVDEATAKIDYYLKHPDIRDKVAKRGYELGRENFTSAARAKELTIIIDRFLNGGIK